MPDRECSCIYVKGPSPEDMFRGGGSQDDLVLSAVVIGARVIGAILGIFGIARGGAWTRNRRIYRNWKWLTHVAGLTPAAIQKGRHSYEEFRIYRSNEQIV